MAEDKVLTDAQKLALSRFKGEEPIETVTKTQEEIDAEKTAADKLLAEQEELRLKAEKEKNTPPAPIVQELNDDQLLEILAKRTGRKITSWDELKPKPEEIDKEKEAEKREGEKLTFGLKKGLFNKKQYEGFISDSKNPIGLVYAAELNEAKKDDTEWSDEKEAEFKEEFETKFGLTLDQSSSKYKRGQKQINIIAETILRQHYSPIFGLENEYSKYESETNKQKELQDKILSAAPIYKQDVEEAVAKLAKIEIPFGDEKYEVPVSKEILDSIQETLMDQDFVSSKIQQGYKKEEIGQIAYNMAITENFATLAHEAAKQYRAKHEKGVRGIIPGGKLDNEGGEYEGLNDNQKAALQFFKPVAQTAN